MAGNVTRYHPLYDMLSLQDSLVRAFDAAVGRNAAQPEANTAKQQGADWAPAVDAYEDSDGLHLFVEVPGVSQSDIDLRIEGTTLTLRGERKLDRNDERQGYRFVERAYGVFQRSFTLPETVDAEHVSAEAKDGVLKIRLPKKAESKPAESKLLSDKIDLGGWTANFTIHLRF